MRSFWRRYRAEISVIRQKTKVSVSKKMRSRMGKWGLRSGDTLANLATVVRLPSGLAHGRRTPEAPGSRPVPPQKPGSACPRARRGFFGPRIAPQSQEVRVPMPAGAFSAPEYTPQGVSRGKSSVSGVLQAYYCRPLRTKPLVSTRPRIPAIPAIQRNGVIKCRLDPPFHMRRGSG